MGTVHNQVGEAVQKARKINQSEDLSPIEVSLLDEIFQGNSPVLAGLDARPTYCFLLEEAELGRRQGDYNPILKPDLV